MKALFRDCSKDLPHFSFISENFRFLSWRKSEFLYYVMMKLLDELMEFVWNTNLPKPHTFLQPQFWRKWSTGNNGNRMGPNLWHVMVWCLLKYFSKDSRNDIFISLHQVFCISGKDKFACCCCLFSCANFVRNFSYLTTARKPFLKFAAYALE